MELKEIQELIKLVSKSSISELKIHRENFSIVIKNQSEQPVQFSYPVAPVVQQPTFIPQQTIQPQVVQEEVKVSSSSAHESASVANENVSTFKAPMVGTFYRKPGADKEPFVKVGDTIKRGDVLCIIEAMKLFNEIEFDGESGKIVKILIDDSSPVEYDQPMFLIEKAK